MDATVAAGWIGAGAAFVGTMAGAGVSVWATVLTQRHETRKANDERRDAAAKLIDERGRAAGNDALAQLYALRRHLGSWDLRLDPDGREAWVRAGREIADQAEIAVGLIPQARGLRVRMEEALWIVTTSLDEDRDRPAREAYRSKLALRHAIDILQAFMRGDALPRASFEVENLRIQEQEYLRENPPGEPA